MCPIWNLFLYASVMFILRTRLVITVQNSFQQQLNHRLQVQRTERQKKPSVLVQSFSAGSLRASVFASRSRICIISFLTDTSIWKTQTSDQNRDTLFILGGKFRKSTNCWYNTRDAQDLLPLKSTQKTQRASSSREHLSEQSSDAFVRKKTKTKNPKQPQVFSRHYASSSFLSAAGNEALSQTHTNT